MVRESTAPAVKISKLWIRCWRARTHRASSSSSAPPDAWLTARRPALCPVHLILRSLRLKICHKCASHSLIPYAFNTGASFPCTNCQKLAVPQFHLAMPDGSIRNFCSYECVGRFQVHQNAEVEFCLLIRLAANFESILGECCWSW